MSYAVSALLKKEANKEGAYKVDVIDHNMRFTTDVIVYKPVGVTPRVGVVFYGRNPVDCRDYDKLLMREANAVLPKLLSKAGIMVSMEIIHRWE